MVRPGYPTILDKTVFKLILIIETYSDVTTITDKNNKPLPTLFKVQELVRYFDLIILSGIRLSG